MKKILFPMLTLALTASVLCSCAITERLDRIDAHRAFDREKQMDGSTVNLWPLLVANKKYTSILWPLMDFDKHGFAIRPFINKERDDWSILWPLLAWNPDDEDGWCALGYWNAKEGTFGIVPLFHWGDKSGGYMTPLCWWGNGNFLLLPLGYYDKDHGFFTILYSRMWGFDNRYQNISYYEQNRMLPNGNRWDNSGKWDFYNALLMFYLKQEQGTILDSKSPEFKKEYLLAHSRDWLLKKALYFRDTGKITDDRETLRKYTLEKLAPATRPGIKNKFGMFPLFHAETMEGSCGQWHALYYLLASGRNTPGDSYFFSPPLLTYWKKQNSENHKKEFLFTPLFYRNFEQTYGLKTDLKLGELAGNRNALEERVLLTRTEDIQEWEKRLQWNKELMKVLPETTEEIQKILDQLTDRNNYELKYEKRGSGMPPLYMYTTEKRGDFTEETANAVFWLYRQNVKNNGHSRFDLGFGALAAFRNFPEGHDWNIPLFWRDYRFEFNKDHVRQKQRWLNWLYYEDASKSEQDGKTVQSLVRKRNFFPFWKYSTSENTAPGSNEYEMKSSDWSILVGLCSHAWNQEKTANSVLYTMLYDGVKKVIDRKKITDPPMGTNFLFAVESDNYAEHASFEYLQNDILATGKATAKIIHWQEDTPDEIRILYNQLGWNLADKNYKYTLDDTRERMKKLNMPEADITSHEVRKKIRRELFDKYAAEFNWERYKFLSDFFLRYAECSRFWDFELGYGLLVNYEKSGNSKIFELGGGLLVSNQTEEDGSGRFRLGAGMLADHHSYYNGRNTSTDVLCGLLYDGEKKTCPDLETAQKACRPIMGPNTDLLDSDYVKSYSFEYSRDRFLLTAEHKDAQILFWKKDTPEPVRNLYSTINYWNEKPDRRKHIVENMQKLNITVPETLPGKELTTEEITKIRTDLALKNSEPREYSANGFLGKLGFYRVTCGDDSAFWLGAGILAKGESVGRNSETSILWYLYRSTVTPESTSRLIFPFIKTYSSKEKSSFSFLWRFVNIEVTENEVSGHILFIPF